MQAAIKALTGRAVARRAVVGLAMAGLLWGPAAYAETPQVQVGALGNVGLAILCG